MVVIVPTILLKFLREFHLMKGLPSVVLLCITEPMDLDFETCSKVFTVISPFSTDSYDVIDFELFPHILSDFYRTNVVGVV
jgi:hypothetical protein